MPRKNPFRRIGDAIIRALGGQPTPDYAQPQKQPKPYRRPVRRPARPLGMLPDKAPDENIFDYQERLQQRAADQIIRWGRQGFLPEWNAQRIRRNVEDAQIEDLEAFFQWSVDEFRSVLSRDARLRQIFGYH